MLYPKMLLIGETGSGKTSFLNLLYNCATVQDLGCGFGAESLEKFKQFNDIKLENAQALSMESKTEDVTLYNVEIGDIKVGVIDTPGFGDLQQDQIHAQRIISILKREEYINCVCLVINGRQARASASLKYVLSEITAILPRRILDNVIFVFSNTSDFLDLNFDPGVLKEYFGLEIKRNMFFVENPYCRLEKANGQLGIANSLKKVFEETSEVLTEMWKAIADFPKVHAYHFVQLYEKKIVHYQTAQPLVPLSTHIHHPSPVYHRDFFLLRMPIKIDNQPSVIKMVGTIPVLHCPKVELSVQLVVLAQHVSTVLAEYCITLKGAYYDDNYPLYAIDLPPPISYKGIQSLLPALSTLCASIVERYFSRVSCKTSVTVHLQPFLCSPAKDSSTKSKVTSIPLGDELDEIRLTFLDSKIFKFSELFTDNFNSSPAIIGSSSKPAAVSFDSLLRALSEKVSHKWLNLGALLGVSIEKLQRIEKQYHNPDACLLHTLKNVVDSNHELTWEKVVSTLSTIGLSNLAEELSREHGEFYTCSIMFMESE